MYKYIMKKNTSDNILSETITAFVIFVYIFGTHLCFVSYNSKRKFTGLFKDEASLV